MTTATVASVLVVLAIPPVAANGQNRQTHRRPTGKPAQKASAQKAPAYSMGALRVQVLLDRQAFSPGEIDASLGANTKKAMDAFAQAQSLPDDATPDALLNALGGSSLAPLVAHTIADAEVAGPFTPEIPNDMMEQAQLPALDYRSPLEALAEQFHVSPALLQQLNPGASFEAGTEIQVPNIATNDQPSVPGSVVVSVSRDGGILKVRAQTGQIVMAAPVTSGSEHDPLPLGNWKVTSVQRNPKFHYNPDLFWDANPAHSKATLPPGPNSPVGVLWIGLDREHYGIHGTAEPSTIGHTTSHGCVRLTNWDAMRLASLVKTGTAVVFEQ
jgi:lipoprotein-anchoring transpeptidase ErfK/SrfK